MKTNSTINYALVTGLSLIIMALCAGIGTFFLDKTSSPELLTVNKSTLGIATATWLIIFITDVIVAWGLFILFRSTHKRIAVFTFIWRMIYSLILLVGILSLIQALFKENISKPELIENIKNFQRYWNFGLITFGIHLAGLFVLCYRHALIPKLITYLIGISALGYVLIQGGEFIISEFSDIKSILTYIFFIPMVFGELGLAILLIIKRKKFN